MTRPVSFFRIVTIVLELYRRKWQGGNIDTPTSCHVLEQTIWLQLILKKAHAFAEIWACDPDHNPERTHTLDAMAPIAQDRLIAPDIMET